jgi:hypothetical protein
MTTKDYEVKDVEDQGDAPVSCSSCEWTGKASETRDIHECSLTPGDRSPVGRCPDCDALVYIDRAETPVDHTNSMPEIMANLKAMGLTFNQCVEAFAAPDDDPFVVRARECETDDMKLDPKAVTAPGDDGTWVSTWIFISNSDAGILKNADVLELVLDTARARLLRGGILADAATVELRNHQADWLEDLIGNFADELDGIETEVPKGIPGPINWLDVTGKWHRFMASDALYQLLMLAREGGLATDTAQKATDFCNRYCNKLDAILTVIQTA